MYPKEVKGRYEADSMKFLFIMGFVTMVFVAILTPIQLEIGKSFEDIFVDAQELLTIAIPPALPVAMSCGIVFALSRLREKQIFCISPTRINMAGQV